MTNGAAWVWDAMTGVLARTASRESGPAWWARKATARVLVAVCCIQLFGVCVSMCVYMCVSVCMSVTEVCGLRGISFVDTPLLHASVAVGMRRCAVTVRTLYRYRVGLPIRIFSNGVAPHIVPVLWWSRMPYNRGVLESGPRLAYGIRSLRWVR